MFPEEWIARVSCLPGKVANTVRQWSRSEKSRDRLVAAGVRSITISTPGVTTLGGFTVQEGDRYCEGLSWDEMLGLVCVLTNDEIKRSHYPMLTAEEWKQREIEREERMKERACA